MMQLSANSYSAAVCVNAKYDTIFPLRAINVSTIPEYFYNLKATWFFRALLYDISSVKKMKFAVAYVFSIVEVREKIIF